MNKLRGKTICGHKTRTTFLLPFLMMIGVQMADHVVANAAAAEADVLLHDAHRLHLKAAMIEAIVELCASFGGETDAVEAEAVAATKINK